MQLSLAQIVALLVGGSGILGLLGYLAKMIVNFFGKYNQDIASLKADVEYAEERNNRLEQGLKARDERLDRLESDYQQLRAENDRIKAENGRIVAENGRIAAENSLLIQENERLKTENKELRAKLDKLTKRVAELESQLTATNTINPASN